MQMLKIMSQVAITGQRTVNQRCFLELWSLNNHIDFIYQIYFISTQFRQFNFTVSHFAPDNKIYITHSIVNM